MSGNRLGVTDGQAFSLPSALEASGKPFLTPSPFSSPEGTGLFERGREPLLLAGRTGLTRNERWPREQRKQDSGLFGLPGPRLLGSRGSCLAFPIRAD